MAVGGSYLFADPKRLSVYENRYTMESETFINDYRNGLLDEHNDFVSWANDYQHYIAIRKHFSGKNVCWCQPMHNDSSANIIGGIDGSQCSRFM
ncbi:MAG TPA: hypothetical protein ENG03_08850 [Thioploca sp.]|nr:hypothetical protein [Thioploca sp.]